MKKTLKKVFYALAVSVTVLLAIVVAVLLYAKATNTVPRFFGYSFMSIISPSMEPAIPVNTYIVVKQTDVSSIKEGDVISFYSRAAEIYGKPNTHRVVSINEREGKLFFTTKGDANYVNDELEVPQEDVIGVYEGKIDFISAVGKLLRIPAVYFVLILIPAAVLFVMELLNFIKRLKEVKAENAEIRKKELIAAEVEKLKKADEENNGNE